MQKQCDYGLKLLLTVYGYICPVCLSGAVSVGWKPKLELYIRTICGEGTSGAVWGLWVVLRQLTSTGHLEMF